MSEKEKEGRYIEKHHTLNLKKIKTASAKHVNSFMSVITHSIHDGEDDDNNDDYDDAKDENKLNASIFNF